MTITRAEREIRHGKLLAASDPESIWGWGTRAGRVRARRRSDLIAAAAGLRPGIRALEIGCGTGTAPAKRQGRGQGVPAAGATHRPAKNGNRIHQPGAPSGTPDRSELASRSVGGLAQ